MSDRATTPVRPTPIRRRTVLAAPLAAAPLVLGFPDTGSAAAAANGHRTVPLPRPGAYPTDPYAAKHDFRATWIATVVNIDWPSKPGLTAAAQQQELIAWLDLAVAQHHNAVVLQVRPTADAFWPSPYEPWSQYLTGTQGGDPGYDPLAFAVAEAHRRNLALHAWFNPYRVSMGDDPSVLLPEHPARRHPDWVIGYGGKLYYNPGLPEVREFVVAAIMDAVDRYDLDAVHFDDYFYPYPVAGQTFDDAATYARYGQGLSLADWRRDNINRLVRGLQRRIKQVKPWVQFGISPFAIWRNVATDPAGSDTTAGAQTYDDLYADTRRWVRDGWIDYLAPQVYWSRGFAAADYEKVTSWWAAQIDVSRRRGHHVGLFVGQATYKVALNADPAWSDPAELSDHLAFNVDFPEVVGNIYFSAKDVRADRLGATSRLTSTWYAHPALLPVVGDTAYRRDERRAPRPVDDVRVEGARVDGTRLQWLVRDRRAVGFAIYRIPGRVDSGDLADATHLVQTLRRTPGRGQAWTDPTPVAGTSYVITAVDRLGRESAGVRAR